VHRVHSVHSAHYRTLRTLCTLCTLCTLLFRDVNLNHLKIEHVMSERVDGHLHARF
jgi:hypothetical protein